MLLVVWCERGDAGWFGGMGWFGGVGGEGCRGGVWSGCWCCAVDGPQRFAVWSVHCRATIAKGQSSKLLRLLGELVLRQKPEATIT